MVGYTEVILQRVREVIEANRRGTWTINAQIVHVKSDAKVGRANGRYRDSSGLTANNPSQMALNGLGRRKLYTFPLLRQNHLGHAPRH